MINKLFVGKILLSLSVSFAAGQAMAKSVAVNGQLVNRNSGKVLDEDVSIPGKVQQWKNYRSLNQTWTVVYHEDGTVEFINVATGRCLDIQAANIADPTANGHYAQTWTCTGSDNQRFVIEPIYIGNEGGISGSDGVRIRAFHSNKCLDVAGVSKANGATVQQWDCHDGLNQRWDITN